MNNDLLGDILSRPPDDRPRYAPPTRAEPLRSAAPRTATSRLIGVFAMLIGVPLWFEAARFTRDGWILGIDWFAARLSIPLRVPALDWRVALLLALALGVAYSRIESQPPIRPPKDWRRNVFRFDLWTVNRTWQVWAVWLFLIVTDIATTYVGARARGSDPNELQILRDLATAGAALVTYAILLTFAPDGLIRYGWHTLIKR